MDIALGLSRVEMAGNRRFHLYSFVFIEKSSTQKWKALTAGEYN